MLQRFLFAPGPRPENTVPCCDVMRSQLDYRCATHGADCPDTVVRYGAFPPPQGCWLLVAENAAYYFEFCPWCGKRFQEALPDEDDSPTLVGKVCAGRCSTCEQECTETTGHLGECRCDYHGGPAKMDGAESGS